MTSSQDVLAVVHPGDVLVGKYRVDRVLGAGGMGVVVAAHHLQLDQKVALKFLLPEALKNAEAVARFAREARAAVKITGEHVARVSDVGQLENGSPYIVMEYLDGVDLSGWLKQRGPLPIEQAIDFVLQACEAIADAHALGIVHRDLKPANLFCTKRSDGQLSIKVLDFGISKVTTPGGGGADVAMTRTSAIVGSPLYMSPEQMQSSKGVDARTDIWSLGVILFELLTATTPFNAEAVTELVIKIAVEPAPPVTALRADIPQGLAHVIATCLEKDRDRRYQTVGELAVALKDFGSRRSRTSVERVVGTLAAAGMSRGVLVETGIVEAPSLQAPRPVPPATMASWGRTGESVPAPPTSGALTFVAVIGGLALITVIAVLALVLSRRSAASTATAVPPASSIVVTPPSAPDPPQAATTTPAESVPATPPIASAATTAAMAHPAPQPSAQRHPATVGQAPSTPVPTSRPAGKASCDPPFFIDAAGHRQYKPECL